MRGEEGWERKANRFSNSLGSVGGITFQFERLIAMHFAVDLFIEDDPEESVMRKISECIIQRIPPRALKYT